MNSTPKRMLVRLRQIHPLKTLVLGYLSYVMVGWALLCLPWLQTGDTVGPLDHLFIATSAMSTTGLATVSPPLTYNFAGELIILLLIQLGGIGYMTFGSFVVLAGRHRFSAWREGITRSAFALPEGFKPARFVRRVIAFTLIVETVGAALLFWAFSQAGVAERAAESDVGASFAGHAHVAWQAIFHSVSAFCTAGFSLFPNSLETYPQHFWINLIISALSLSGAIGFIVMSDVFGTISGRQKRITLTSRIILYFTAWIIVLGAALLFLADPALRQLPGEERMLVAWFQSMTAATTVGFNTYPIGALGHASVLLMYLLMIVGASPSGTGGGLKSTSLSAIYATVRSNLRGQSETTFAGKQIPRHRLQTAYSALGFYALTLAIGGYLLLITESRPVAAAALDGMAHSFEDLLYEAASALGTVGLSRGVTGDLTDLGKIVIIVMMFIGRLGPLTFGLVLFARATPTTDDETDHGDTHEASDAGVVEDVAI